MESMTYLYLCTKAPEGLNGPHFRVLSLISISEGQVCAKGGRCCTALAESEIRLWWWPRYVRA